MKLCAYHQLILIFLLQFLNSKFQKKTNIRMKYTTFFLLFIFTTLFKTVGFSQIEFPEDKVKWNFKVEQKGCEATVIATVTMATHWHINSIVLPKGTFGYATKFELNKSADYKILGTVSEPKPIQKHDDEADEDLSYHEGKVVFKYKIQVLTNKDFVLKAVDEYLAGLGKEAGELRKLIHLYRVPILEDLKTQIRANIKAEAQVEQAVQQELAAIPVFPFLIWQGTTAIVISFTVSMLSHFLVGAARSVFTGRSVFRSGLDMFVVGVGVAVVGYFVGGWVGRFF